MTTSDLTFITKEKDKTLLDRFKVLIKDTRLLLDEIYEFDKPVSQEIIEAVELELQKLGSQ